MKIISVHIQFIVVYPVIPKGLVLLNDKTAMHTLEDVEETLLEFSSICERSLFNFIKRLSLGKKIMGSNFSTKYYFSVRTIF